MAERKIAFFPGVRLLVVGLIALIATFAAKDARAYTPNDPVVVAMVNRGLEYLEASSKKQPITDGEAILVAYAHFKCRHDLESAVVQHGLSEAQKVVASVERRGGESVGAKENYIISISVLLLSEIDAKQFKRELQVLQQALVEGQYPSGAFSYRNDNEGDVSQTQYAMLAVWTLDRNGIPLDYNQVEKCIQWLLRVQSTDGGWPYKGKDPGIGKPNRQQSKVDMSMSLAGGSSLLIAGDALRLWGNTVQDSDPGIPGLPKAIKVYKEDKNTARRKRVNMSEEPIKRAVKFMDGWRRKNPYKRSQLIDWYYYQLYTLERFESFVEIANGLPKDSSPAWYNQGVDELRKYQDGEGGWSDRSLSKPQISTAFALLFLIRSTQRTIFTMNAGSLQGGYGLPKDTTDIRVDGTQIKGQPIAVQVTDLLDILDEDGSGDTEGKSIPDDLVLDTDPVVRAAQLDRLERLVRGSRSWQARRVAARLLGRTDELRVVPSLIYALSDPDQSVRLYARDGLRFLSRKFDGFGMPDTPSVTDLQTAQRKWRDWYRSVNPNYVFLDYDL
ncbi:MAG: hypothetical protein P8L85_05630 [Rubripirellula sp.]|nr:hypothetical protein [Rubripirellula sp.]